MRSADSAESNPWVVWLSALLGALLTASLFKLGVGKTTENVHFSSTPQYAIYVVVLAGLVAMSVVVAISIWPYQRSLVRRTSRAVRYLAYVLYLLIALFAYLGPMPIGRLAHYPLPLYRPRVSAVYAVAFIAGLPAFSGILFISDVLRTKGRLDTAVEGPASRELIIDLISLRSNLLRFLVAGASIITGQILAAGALVSALLAYGYKQQDLPTGSLLFYSAFFAGLLALIYIPVYLSWQRRGQQLRDVLYPFPPDGLPDHDWYTGRNDFEQLLNLRIGVGATLGTAFSLLAPFVGALVTTLLSHLAA
jgi:hypothetical protein